MERRIYFVGSNEKKYYYLLKKNIGDPEIASNEDFIYSFFIEQMRMILNNKFISYRESSYRNLKINSLIERYVGKNLALIEDHPCLTSFQEILDQHFINNGKDIDLALSPEAQGQLPIGKGNLQPTINKFMKKNSGDEILHRFVIDYVKNYEDFFLFRKEFTYNYSSLMFFNHVLGNSIIFQIFLY